MRVFSIAMVAVLVANCLGRFGSGAEKPDAPPRIRMQEILDLKCNDVNVWAFSPATRELFVSRCGADQRTCTNGTSRRKSCCIPTYVRAVPTDGTKWPFRRMENSSSSRRTPKSREIRPRSLSSIRLRTRPVSRPSTGPLLVRSSSISQASSFGFRRRGLARPAQKWVGGAKIGVGGAVGFCSVVRMLLLVA